ncbi:outer membrane lipoprotein chaperone LolA [Longimicrobium sp.]|jgi:outer membrane lipoprotein carrier protein|uniref:outer membrane lipoprotein chaperone LolA n=1 Tax=Longimicrobium sp. TaxID=2029185 RepID=UPI002ED93E8D
MMMNHLRIPLLALTAALAACGGRGEPSTARTDAPKQAPADGQAPAARIQRPAPGTGQPVDVTNPALPAPRRDGTAQPAAAPGQPAPGQAAPAPAAGARSSDRAAEILTRVEQAAYGIRSLEADFTQTLNVPLLGSNQRSSGKLYQRKPDRFLMRFSDPDGDVIVADGRYFWLYYPSSDRTQVIRTSIAEGGQSVDLQQQFLSNPNQRFVATLAGDESVAGRSSYVLTLVPRGASAYRILKIWVDKEDYLVRRFEMTEENESVRRVELRNVRTNHALANSLFTFTPPAGAQIIQQ